MAAPAQPRHWWSMTLPEVWEVLRRFCVGTETRRLIFRSIVFSFAIRVAILFAAYSAGYGGHS
jgi:hypothetical protein